MSSVPSAVETVSREAWLKRDVFFTLAELGSSGLSWCAVSVVTLGWLSPKASAVSPSRSTLDLNVTSKLPVFVARVDVDGRRAPPSRRRA